MTYKSKMDNSTLLQTACAIVFIIFVFTYLYFFQSDLLFMIQHVLSGGTTHYNKTVGAVVITFVLYLIQVGARKLGGLSGDFYVFTYSPSLVLLMALTGVDPDFTDMPFRRFWLWFAPSFLIGYVVVALFLRMKPKQQSPKPTSTVAGRLWKNLLVMAIMFIAVCLCSNSNTVFHYRLKMEGLLNSDEYEKALRIGEKSDDTDVSLTMLRIYALSRSKQLGERLFEYPVVGGSDALLPGSDGVRCLFFPERRIFSQLSIRKKGVMRPMDYLLYIDRNGLAMKSATDYILCGYLLDRNLDGFVSAVKGKYNLASPELPKHYKEALTLYTHLRANPILVYHNEVMDADYADFQNLSKKYSDIRERISYVRDTYGDTYWFYYFYEQKT